MLAQFFKHFNIATFEYGDALNVEMHYRRYMNKKVICNDWTRVFRKFKELEDGSTDERVAKGILKPYQRSQKYGISIDELKTNEDGSKIWEIKYGIQGT